MWLLTFAILLFVAVLLSCRARETVLSTAVLFLLAGLAFGYFRPSLAAADDTLFAISEVTLFAVLFSDGMRTSGVRGLTRQWRTTGRVLFVGMALVIVIVATCGHYLLRMDWVHALLVGAVLAPTDPVFVSGIFSVDEVSDEAKSVLNLESGFNDGLALPAVLLLMSAVQGNEEPGRIAVELVTGIALGVAIPFVAVKLEQSRLFGAAGVFERLHAFAIGLMIFAAARALSANEFLAAFSGGITVVSLNKKVHEAFEGFGEVVTELLKLAALLIFGVRVSAIVLRHHAWSEYLFIVIAVFLARPVAVFVATIGAHVPTLDRWILGWFGPKGFASVVYGLMILRLGTDAARFSARIVALAVVVSILVFSSTDVIIGKWLRKWGERASSREGTKAA
jgi:sodium/hydrogen antiporter